jgi:hypothetical protein
MGPFAAPRGWNAPLIQFLGNRSVAGGACRLNFPNYRDQVFGETLRSCGSASIKNLVKCNLLAAVADKRLRNIWGK